YRASKAVLLATWQRCVDHLRDELPSQQFNTWIRPLHAESNAEGLTLFAHNRFVQDWVKDKFYSRICELVNRHSNGEAVGVYLEVGRHGAVRQAASMSVASSQTSPVQQSPVQQKEASEQFVRSSL